MYNHKHVVEEVKCGRRRRNEKSKLIRELLCKISFKVEVLIG